MANKKYYWLKLKEDFFSNPDIKLLKSQKDGKDYIILYLQLQLISLRNEGILRHKNILPYTPDMLATLTDTSVGIVKQAVELFISLGMVEQWNDGTLYMSEMQKLIGRESESTERVRRHREIKNQQLLPLHCNADVTKSNTELEKELEIDKEKEKPLCDYDNFFESIWALYPNKKGKASIKVKQKKILYEIGIEELTRCIERYSKDIQGKDKQYIKHGSTFFNGGYVDYLDKNYCEKVKITNTKSEWGGFLNE